MKLKRRSYRGHRGPHPGRLLSIVVLGGALVAGLQSARAQIDTASEGGTADARRAPSITPADPETATVRELKYPPEMVADDGSGFDGAFIRATEYSAADGQYTVATWESGPGVLQTDGYPAEEFCHVLEGRLVITNHDGSTQEYGPGDRFVIPRGWVGTWDMKTRFKKRYVAWEPK